MNKSIEDIKFGFCKNAKYFLLSTLVIILAGLIVWLCCDFNAGIDITGGYVVEIRYTETNLDTNDVYDKISGEAIDIIEDNGFSVQTVQKMGENLNTELVIKYQANDTKNAEIDQKNETLHTALTDKYGTDNVSKVETIEPTFNSSTILKLSLAMLVTLVAVVVYMSIRYHYSMGIASMFAFALDMLLLLALTAICRIQVTESFMAVVGAVGVMSLLFNAVLFTAIRNNNRKNIDSSETAVNGAIKKSLNFNVLLGIAIVIILFFIFNAVSSTGGFALALILSLFVTLFTSTFISAPMWKMIYRPNTKQAPTEIEQKD